LIVIDIKARVQFGPYLWSTLHAVDKTCRVPYIVVETSWQ